MKISTYLHSIDDLSEHLEPLIFQVHGTSVHGGEFSGHNAVDGQHHHQHRHTFGHTEKGALHRTAPVLVFWVNQLLLLSAFSTCNANGGKVKSLS